MQSFPLIHSFDFCGFSYLGSTVVRKYQIENFRNNQCMNFKLHAIWSRMVKSLLVFPYPALDVNQPFVQCLYDL